MRGAGMSWGEGESWAACWRRRGWGRLSRVATQLVSSSPVNRGARWRGGKQKGSSRSLRSRGGGGGGGPARRTPGPWPLTSAPLGSPGAARPLFTQDAPRGPRSCGAGALPAPPSPARGPSPCAASPSPCAEPRGRILRRGTPAPPRPAPPPRGPGLRRLRPARPAGRGAGRCGAAGAGRARGGGRPGPRPSLGLDLLTAIGPLVPRPLLGRAAPTLPQNPGEETGWLLSPPPFNFFFPLGVGGRGWGRPANSSAAPAFLGKYRHARARRPLQPSLFKSFASGGPTRGRRPEGLRRRPAARSPPLPVGLLCALEAPRPATFSPAPGGLR